jgi:hemolysin activation/secretion protein
MASVFKSASFSRFAPIFAAVLPIWYAPPVRGGAQGQDVPQSSTLQTDDQRLNRYYDRQYPVPTEQPTDPLPEASVSAPAAATPSPQGDDRARFALDRVEFTESALLDLVTLQGAVAPFIGKPVSRDDLIRMLDAINALYTARHITTARAVLQAQAIVHGVVRIELVEGRLSALQVVGARPNHDAFIRRRLRLQLEDVVDSDRLRRDLVYLNRTSSLSAQALLRPGDERGQTDVLIHVNEPKPRSFEAFVDNGGADSTGRTRAGLQAHLYGLAAADDRLDGNLAHSRGGNSGSVSYSIPVSPSNSRLGVSYARSQVNIVNDAFRELDITGTSSVASLEYRQPFVATLNWLFGGIGSYSLTQSATRISGESIADTTSRSVTLGLSLEHQRDGQRWSVTQLATRLRSDEPLLGKDEFTLVPGSAYYIQRFGRSRWALRADAGWQWSAGKNIPSASLFQIGGLGSVRGYERGVLAGPRGYYLALELHRTVGERLDLFVFTDYGATQGFYPRRNEIAGAGLGASYQRGWFSMSGDVGSAFDAIVPDQNRLRFNVRMSIRWN